MYTWVRIALRQRHVQAQVQDGCAWVNLVP
jgi:hypothetical protein